MAGSAFANASPWNYAVDFATSLDSPVLVKRPSRPDASFAHFVTHRQRGAVVLSYGFEKSDDYVMVVPEHRVASTLVGNTLARMGRYFL